MALSALSAASAAAQAQSVGDYEGRPVAAVEVVLEGSPADQALQGELQARLKIAPNMEYSAARVRQSLQALFDSGRVASARVEIAEAGPAAAGGKGPIRVRFIARRQVVIGEVKLDIAPTTGTPVSNDEIRARLNLLEPGRRFSRQAVAQNADEIQTYLRDRGYFNATIDYSEAIDPTSMRATVTYKITPGEQSRVESFTIEISGFAYASMRSSLKLQPGEPFTRDLLAEDFNRVRQQIIAQGYLAPTLNEPRVERNPETGRITITLKGAVGPKVEVEVKGYDLSEKKARELLPVKREGNIDQSVIVEGARRLRNKLQEQGNFFAEVTPVCTITPAVAGTVENGTQAACENLNPEELSGHTILITYEAERGRRFRLTDIRITGTNKLTPADIEGELRTQKANALGLIPFIGYGRGYTSNAILQEDKRTVEAHMRDLGYRLARADVLQGVTISGDSLIITFHVTEGPLTRAAGIEIQGGKVYSEDRLRAELRIIKDAPYSRSEVRADADRLYNLYARDGYLDAQIDTSIVELPKKGADEQVRVVYTITNEGEKAIINNIIINGVTGSAATQRKKRDAIVRAIPLSEGDVLRADERTEAERALYVTDAYSQVIIRAAPAGETASGAKKYDVIIDVEEKKPRVIEYGGGYSSDTGPLGLLEISNINLMNKLRQGAVRLRASGRQQLLRFEYLDQRFARYGKKQFAPLALSVQYQRDSTITRFFRSTIDKGAFGIVQRLDEKGNPINVLGQSVGEPTINRFTFNVETQRVLSQKTRSTVFARYTYEDVRLFNIDSLLIQPILVPDRVVRLSRFGASFVRDTRERCERRIPGAVLPEETASRRGQVCRYNQLDPTRGDFLSADYSVALRQLGGNISFSRFQSNYRKYYKLEQARGTVLAGNLTVGLARLFNPRDRDGNGRIDDADLLLPISERFFSGGSTTLRGFGFEEAGPRQVIVPEGTFRDRNGKQIFLNPFTVPVGGNAELILNLEARIPLSRNFQAVPFYDGGNVYRRASDIFGHAKPSAPTGDFVQDINAANGIAHWTHTAGLGFRIKTPYGGALAIDYGYLLNPPQFLIPQKTQGVFDSTAIFRPRHAQIHFRFTQTF